MPELSLSEWRKEGRRLKKEGLSIGEIQEKIGKYNGTYRLEHSNSKGINFRNVSIRNARAELEKVPEASRDLFPKGLDPKDPNSFEHYKGTVAQDKLGIDSRTKLASQERGIKYNKGHGQSAKTGGPTSSRNLMLENGSRNSGHGAANPSRGSLLNTGVSTSWKEDAINYQDPSGLPQEYTPQDKQRIRNAPADKVDDVTAEVDAKRWKAIKENPNARPIRTNPKPNVVNPPKVQNFHGLTIDKTKPGVRLPRAPRKLLKKGLSLVPIAGGIDALSRSAAAAQKGDYATAAVNVGEAIVGELPGGDAVIESVIGQGVADATVTGLQRDRAARPSYYGKNGPDLTTPEQSNRAALLRKDPTQERGYETVQRVMQQGSQMVGGWLKKLGIN
jgi:hypothetical protein